MFAHTKEEARENRRNLLSQPLITEEVRVAVILWLAWASWLASFVIVFLRATGAISQQFGPLALLTIGMAVAASLSRGRTLQTETLEQVFKAGAKIGLDAGSERKLAEDVANNVTANLQHKGNQTRQGGGY
jgi:hypothetical protein